MTDDKQSKAGASLEPAPAPRKLTPEAQRALAEAEERRRQREAKPDAQAAPEKGGQAGPEPTRYGDWEKAGIVSDF